MRQCRQAFLAAARGSDIVAQEHSLLAWARAERPSIQNLGDLAAALGDPHQRRRSPACSNGAMRVQTRRHGGFAGQHVRARIRLARATRPGDELSDLPPLYPFKLG